MISSRSKIQKILKRIALETAAKRLAQSRNRRPVEAYGRNWSSGGGGRGGNWSGGGGG